MFNTAVARPVARKEMMENEDARKAMRKEWLGQHAAGVYDFSIVREYDDVVREAKKSGKEVHVARIHGICEEKNYQLPKDNPTRKFKGKDGEFCSATKSRTSSGRLHSFGTLATRLYF